MTVPVPFSDIGKSAKDLLGKDYPVGSVNLEVKTTAANGLQFTVTGSQDNAKGSIIGDLKTKYVSKPNGLTITEVWSSSNVLSGEVELEDTITKGLKLGATGWIAPPTGNKNVKVNVAYKQDYLNTRTSLDLFKGPTLSGDIVLGSDGLLFGGEVAYDVSDAKIARHSIAAGYTASDYAVSLHALNGFKTYTASYYHRVNADVEAGAKATWDAKSTDGTVGIEVGTKYILDKDAFFKAKINNDGRLGLGFTQVVRPGVKLSLGGSIDTTRLNDNAHKLGLAITLES